MATPFAALPHADPEVLSAPLADADAKRLDKSIRRMAKVTCDNFAKLVELVEMAKHGQVHVALAFPSWTAYLADALGGQLELSSDARREVVALMAGHGMSERAMAAALGVSQPTVHRDLGRVQVIHDESPDYAGDAHDGESMPPPVTGRDGKTYARHKPAPRPPSPPRPSRRGGYTSELTPVRLALRQVPEHVARFDRFADDAKFWVWFAQNDSRVADIRREVTKAITALEKLQDRLETVGGESK